MPTLKTPLIGSYNNRPFVALGNKDQFFRGAVIERIINKQSNSATYYTEKRPGLSMLRTPAAGKGGGGVYKSPTSGRTTSIFLNAGGGIDVWDWDGVADTNCGTISAALQYYVMFTETILNGITYVLMAAIVPPAGSAGSTGWYLASDAIATTAYTADGNNSTTITDLKIAGVNSVAGLYIGQKLSAGANIVAGSRIVSINAGAFSLVLDTATTGGAFNDLAVTKEPIAKMNDPDFPTNISGGFAEQDGYVSIMTADRKVFSSDLNTVSSWNPSSFLTCTKYVGIGIGIVRYNSRILAFTNAGMEFLYNAGNAAGSVFSSADQAQGSTSIPPSFATNCTVANGTPFWLGSDGNIYTLDGYTPKKLSSTGVFATSQWVFNGQVTSFILNKKTYLNIFYAQYLATLRNFWYCVDDDSWSEPYFGSSVSTVAYFTYASGNVYVVLGDTSGKIYFLSDAYPLFNFQDNAVTNTMSIQIQTDMGTEKRKFGGELRLIADVQASGTLSVSWSDDDGTTFNTPVTMSLTDQTNMKLSRIGSWKGRRLWKFEHSANTPFRASGIEIDYTVST